MTAIADIIAEFIGFMESEGVRAVEPIAQRLATGELIRFCCDGDGKGRRNGYAILYADGVPAGAFGNYKSGIKRKWKSNAQSGLTPQERAALAAEWTAAKAKRDEERLITQREVAAAAGDLWKGAKPVGDDHGYLVAKAMPPRRWRVHDGNLLIPMFDCDGSLWNLQRIAHDGTKRFLKGGRTDGLFTVIGEFSSRYERVGIGEGVATMDAVHRATGYPCIVAFTASNLSPVARLWADLRPDLDFIMCADDDAHLEAAGKENQGKVAAINAAREIGARVAFPPREAA